MRQIMLDRDQREALRSDLELWFPVDGVAFNRDDVHSAMRQLRFVADVMDAVGWIEQPDATDLQLLTVSPELTAWARTFGDDLLADLPVEPDDEYLDEIAVLATIGGDA